MHPQTQTEDEGAFASPRTEATQDYAREKDDEMVELLTILDAAQERLDRLADEATWDTTMHGLDAAARPSFTMTWSALVQAAGALDEARGALVAARTRLIPWQP